MSLARFSPQAARDLDEICLYIAADNPAAAGQVRSAILDFADLIARYPALGRRIRGAGARHTQICWVVVPPYPNYLVFFQPHADSIMVVRLLHAAQDWMRFFPRNGP